MKLLKVIMYNLASLEGEQVIDFESEPLRSADLFSIVGETGSGKSTILDAVCLALYGLAPRFYGADNFDYYHTERPNNDQVLDPDDPRNILRKGTKECFAEVVFLARDGFRYRPHQLYASGAQAVPDSSGRSGKNQREGSGNNRRRTSEAGT